MKLARHGVIGFAAVLASATLLAGCTAGPVGGDEEPEGRRSPSASASKEPLLTDPTKILSLADLDLPADATDVVVTHKEFPDSYRTKPDYAYTVTFTASRKSLDALSEQMFTIPVSELFPIPAGEPDSLFGSSTVTEITPGSRSADGSFDPGTGSYGGFILLVDGPELTTAHVTVTSSPT